jgi:hypothetical protein
MAEQGPLNINVNLNTNAQQAAQNVEQFNQALGRVNQQARRLFASLSDLSQRYQQQGFLGMGDQRILEQGLRQWERMSQVVNLQRHGAMGRLAEAQARTDEGSAMRVRQAEGVLARMTAHQEALGALRGGFGNVLQRTIPGPTTPWYPGRGLPYGAATGPPPPSGRVAPWYPGYGLPYGAAPAPGAATARGRISPWYPGYGLPYGPTMSPLQAAHRMQFGTPIQPLTPLQQAHADLQSQQAAAAQAGLQQAQLISLMAQLSGGSVGGGGASGGTGTRILNAVLGGGGMRALGGLAGGAIGGPVGALIGGAVGGLAGGAAHAMLPTLPGIQEISLLKLGDTLNQQFGHLRATMIGLRREFQVLNVDGRQAMQELATATGLEEVALRRVTREAVGAGRYYGLSATESVGMVTALRMMGSPDPQLTAVMAIGHEAAARHPGTISVPRFAAETVKAAAAGGLGFAPMSESFHARDVQFMQEMGGRYAMNPGAAVLQRAEQMGRPTSTIGQVIQVSALDQLRQRQRYVTLGKGPDAMRLDLNDPMDMQIAMENIAQIPEAREALRGEIVRQAPGNPSYQRFYYGRATEAPSGYQARLEWEGTQRVAREFGGVDRFLERPADVAGERARRPARAAAEAGDIGRIQLEVARLLEEFPELAPVRAFAAASNSVATTLGALAESFNKGLTPTAAFSNTMEKLAPVMENFLTAMQTLQTAQGATGGVWGTSMSTTGLSQTVTGLGTSAMQLAQNLGVQGLAALFDFTSLLGAPLPTPNQGPQRPQR